MKKKSYIIGRDYTRITGNNSPENPLLNDNRNFSIPRVNRYHINRGYGAIYRQSMPYISDNESGLLFIAFSGSIEEFTSALKRMAGHKSDDGSIDAVFEITRSTKNGFYYVPTIKELQDMFAE